MIERFKTFLKAEAGTGTVEFCLFFPAFIFIFMSTIEAGVLMLRSVLLERGVDITVRQMRLGGEGTPSNTEELRVAICTNAGMLLNCGEILQVELTRLDQDTWAFPDNGVECDERDLEVEPALEFTNGIDHDVMLIRACALFNPMFPTTGLGLRMVEIRGDNSYALISTSAFVVEPA